MKEFSLVKLPQFIRVTLLSNMVIMKLLMKILRTTYSFKNPKNNYASTTQQYNFSQIKEDGLHDHTQKVFQVLKRNTQDNKTDGKLDWNFYNCHLQLHELCPSGKIRFYLYHKYFITSEIPYLINAFEPRFPLSINSSLPLKVIVHGYGGHVLAGPIVEIRKAYQTVGGKNVIIIDWGQLAMLPCYPTSVLNTAQVGQCSAEFLVKLIREYRPRYVHLIGFSLGAHIASFIGNYIQDVTGRKIRRITGLDPALPLFANLKGTYKLDKRDAKIVDVIHTNVGVFGKMEPTGHVDFYVNEGSSQPACVQHRNPPLCSHLLAPIYYAESITSQKGFWGTSCPSYFQYAVGWCPLPEPGSPEEIQRILMGEYLLRGSRGIYLVKTRSEPPFALG